MQNGNFSIKAKAGLDVLRRVFHDNYLELRAMTLKTEAEKEQMAALEEVLSRSNDFVVEIEIIAGGWLNGSETDKNNYVLDFYGKKYILLPKCTVYFYGVMKKLLLRIETRIDVPMGLIELPKITIEKFYSH